jgi:hypothetical protein
MIENQKIRPAQVIGPLGEPLTIADLPSPSTKRWVVRRKAEVVAAVNGGLMTIDETLHRFSPDSGLRRTDAVAALLRLLAINGRDGGCEAARGAPRELVCSAGAACGLLDDELLCQAGGGLSGAEAIELLRRALDRLEKR